MLTQAWVNGIAIAVVAAGLVNAWLALRAPTKKPGKETRAKTDAPPRGAAADAQRARRWMLLRNEEEIRRQARAAKESAEASTKERAGPDGRSSSG